LKVTRRPWLAVLVFALAPAAVLAQTAAEDRALARLDAAVRAAWERAPSLEASNASIAMTLVEAEASAASGGAYLQLQAEGIGSSFDEEPNAARYVRVGKPFSWPGQARAGSRLVEQGDTWGQAARRQVRLGLAGDAAEAWIELAGQQQVVRVLERIAGRLEDAVTLQREKEGLGEVSGSDLLQLELEQIDARSNLAQARAEREALLQTLVRLAGDGAPAPQPGDLGQLVSALEALDGDPCGDAGRRSATVVRAEQRAELARRSARLVSRTKWGRPSAEVEWESIPDIDGATGFDALGVMLEMPLPFGRAGKLAQARAEADARRVAAEADRVRRGAEARCHTALSRARSGEEQLDLLREMEGRLEDAEISLAGQFRLGVASYMKYIDGINRLEDVRLRGIRARTDYLGGRARLAALLGRSDLFPLPATSAEDSR
jgi:outer membrane protein TolC